MYLSGSIFLSGLDGKDIIQIGIFFLSILSARPNVLDLCRYYIKSIS